MATVFEFGVPPIDPRCGFLPCTQTATWHITVHIPQPGNQVAEVYLGQGACNLHKDSLESKKVIDAAMWDYLAGLLKTHGYEVPPKESIRLVFESLDGTTKKVERYG